MIFLAIAVVLGVFGASQLFGGESKPAPANSASAAVAEKTVEQPKVPPKPVKNTITTEQMAAKINAIIAANPDVETSVSITNVQTGETLQYGLTAGVVYEAASVGKLVTAVYLLRQVQDGEESLDQSVGNTTAKEALRLMIENSDNTSWHNLNDMLGKPNLLTYARSIGMDKYNPNGNLVNPANIALLLTKLYKGELLNKKYQAVLLGHMEKANRTDYIKAAVPTDVKFYHKAGWVEDRNHDAAIIDDGHDPYVLVIFTNGHGKPHRIDRARMLQQITAPTIDHFIGIQELDTATATN